MEAGSTSSRKFTDKEFGLNSLSMVEYEYGIV